MEEEPTYHRIGGHAEAIRIVYDPVVIDYEDLFGRFARNGRPLGGFGQYRAAVFPQDDEQRRVVEQHVQRLGGGRAARSGVVEAGRPEARFWDAEGYHQKYRLRRDQGLVRRLSSALGPAWDRFPIATKLNALASSGGSAERWLGLLPAEGAASVA